MLTATAILISLAAPALIAPAQDHDRKESPFEALRWQGNDPEVRVSGTWYRPVSVHAVAVTDILAFCGKRWPGEAKRRFGEDLVEAMDLMGHLPPRKVTLVVRALDREEVLTLADIEMSRSNRIAILRAPREAVARSRGPVQLGIADARADLDEFQRCLEDQFAYLHWKGIDLDAELETLASDLPDPVPVTHLSKGLSRLMLRFGDGHANVSSPQSTDIEQFPPVIFEEAGGGVVALLPDRSAFADPARPFVLTIDGEPLAAWLEAARPFVVAGSPQVVRHRALYTLMNLEGMRRARGRPAAETLSLGLAATPDGKPVTVSLAMSQAPLRSRSRLRERDTDRLEDDIGYLRLDRMDNRRVPELHDAMAGFRDTRGLIVDVRGNGGGSRGLLLALAGYLTGPDEGPFVANVARYRLSAKFDDDHLEARYMYRASAEHWSAAEREAIRSQAQAFQPEWSPPEGFSEWHYLVLGQTDHPGEYFYDKPVVILSDAGCFSATDIFLGALHGRPRVTLLGQPSGGGSARSQGFSLPKSGISVRCASMASFRADGRMYDGRGIEVDVRLAPAPEDLLAGGGDRQLEAARQRLLGR